MIAGTRVTEVVLQIGDRDPAFDQDRRAAVAQTVEGDGAELCAAQSRIEALSEETFAVHRPSVGRGKDELVRRGRALELPPSPVAD